MSRLITSYPERSALITAFFIYLLLVGVNFFLIKNINSSFFTYTIDDPYIHLSLAENIRNFHYGINQNEYSSPSSSIIYSLIFVPFIYYEFAVYLPLLVNIVGSIGILFFFWKLFILIFSEIILDNHKKYIIISSFLIIIILAGNLVYSTFRGMEHSLQALTSVAMIWGIINFILHKKVSGIFYVSAIISPLVRYENLALTFLLLLYLFIHKQKRILWIVIIISFFLIGFSLFLVQLGLEPLPLSVLRKSKLPDNNLVEVFFNQSTVILLLFLTFFFNYIRISRSNKSENFLSGIISLVIIIHIGLGMSGRYTEYLIITALFVLIFLYRNVITSFLTGKPGKKLLVLIAVTILIFYKQTASVFLIPFAANNIFEQQYQMHRFASEYYKKPIAVNDIGYVSFRNDNYVLDLYGLSSLESYRYWNSQNDFNWMDSLVLKHKVNLIMIYEGWFKSIPQNWRKVAELHLGNIKITASGRVVSFFIRDISYYNEVKRLLCDFKETLPGKTKLILF
ncbi:MAG: hypothetical protein ACK4R9_07525 [Ignavibacterium sp.]